MCLIVNESLRRPRSLKTVYKVYEAIYPEQFKNKNRKTFSLETISQNSTIEFKAGKEIVSNRAENMGEKLENKRDNSYEWDEIFYGFHVFTDKDAALSAQRVWERYVVVEFQAKPEHWIGSGTNNGSSAGAVYSRLTCGKIISPPWE